MVSGLPYLINALQIGTQTTVHTEHATVNDCAQSQIIKNLATPPPYIGAAIFPLTFIIKSIHLRYLAGLVVSSNKRDPFGISDLQGQQ